MKRSGIFEFGGGFMEFRDTTNLFDYEIDFPDSLTNILGFRWPVDFKSELDYIDIIKGKLPTEVFVVIVDQNNNRSFKDDPMISLRPIDWYSSQNSIPVSFLVSDGSDTVQNNSWIRIGHWQEEIIYGRDEYLFASISIDNKRFDLGVIDQLSGSFTYSLGAQIALFSSELGKKDTIEIRDLIRMREFLKLNGSYYLFDSINNSGEYIRLIKEKNFDEKVGLQVGMLAPDFAFKSASGDTLNTTTMHNKPLIIANTCGCGGDIESPKAYFEIRNTFQEEAYILRLDSFSENPSDEWTINMKDVYNKDAYHKFRQAYCSRICYVIGQNQRILDKLLITDWKMDLPKLFNN
ncbi:MAG: hypothetical protein ABJQ84_09280 [Ekhidna sp.]